MYNLTNEIPDYLKVIKNIDLGGDEPFYQMVVCEYEGGQRLFIYTWVFEGNGWQQVASLINGYKTLDKQFGGDIDAWVESVARKRRTKRKDRIKELREQIAMMENEVETYNRVLDKSEETTEPGWAVPSPFVSFGGKDY